MGLIIYTLKILVKVILILIGGLMLIGGGMCVLIGGVSLPSTGSSMLGVMGIAAVVALIGFGLVRLAESIGKSPDAENEQIATQETFWKEEDVAQASKTETERKPLPKFVVSLLILVPLLGIGWNLLNASSYSPAKHRQMASNPAESVPQHAEPKKLAPDQSPATESSGNPSLAIGGEDSSFVMQPEPCNIPGLKLPADFAIYAGGAYTGRTLDFQIDRSGHRATLMQVEVNRVAQPVVLMLGAYEPTVWEIRRTSGTQILAVVVSGYNEQRITGLKPDVPVLNSSYGNRGECGFFYFSSEPPQGLKRIAEKLFGRDVDRVFPAATNGLLRIGDPLAPGESLVSGAMQDVASFRLVGTPLAGDAGLQQAVDAGLLRPATTQDVQQWYAAQGRSTDVADVTPRRAYVVLGQFTYPAGLYGANAASFYIPRGVSRPTGNPGHSGVYDFNTLAR